MKNAKEFATGPKRLKMCLRGAGFEPQLFVVAQSFVSKFERGEPRLDDAEFLDVARALGIDPARTIADLEPR